MQHEPEISQYVKLKAQIADLQLQAKEVRSQEVVAVIADVQRMIAEYGVTAQDLGFEERPHRGRPPKKVPPAAKYRDPKSGATWSGRGKPPGWIVGKNRDRFLIA